LNIVGACWSATKFVKDEAWYYLLLKGSLDEAHRTVANMKNAYSCRYIKNKEEVERAALPKTEVEKAIQSEFEEDYNPIADSINDALINVIENIEWDLDNKKVHIVDDMYPGHDSDILNAESLISELDVMVTQEVTDSLPLHYIKEFEPFDHREQVIKYLLENKEKELKRLGWFEDL